MRARRARAFLIVCLVLFLGLLRTFKGWSSVRSLYKREIYKASRLEARPSDVDFIELQMAAANDAQMAQAFPSFGEGRLWALGCGL